MKRSSSNILINILQLWFFSSISSGLNRFFLGSLSIWVRPPCGLWVAITTITISIVTVTFNLRVSVMRSYYLAKPAVAFVDPTASF